LRRALSPDWRQPFRRRRRRLHLQSWGYFNRAKELYRLLGIPERLQFASTDNSHHATGDKIDAAWQSFLHYFLQEKPIPKSPH
jgi:hypothetical protein